MHLDRAGADAADVKVELHVGMVGEEGHGNSGVDDALPNHERGEALAEGVVVRAGVPDGDFFCAPCFERADADCFRGHKRDVAAAGGAGVLRDRERMQIDNAGW